MQEQPSPVRTRRATRSRLAGFALILLLLGWIGSTLAVTWSLTHRASPQRPEPPFEIAGASRLDLTLNTPDGQTLGAWFFPGRPGAPAILVMHGNNGSRGKSKATIETLVHRGCHVLAVTLRAHGDSTGDVNDIGWSARHDVTAAVTELERRCPDSRIAIFGRSMSSAAAIFAARELGPRVHGYWLEQPYNSLATAAWRRLQQQLPPLCDYVAYAGMRLWTTAFLPVSLESISPADSVSDIPRSAPS